MSISRANHSKSSFCLLALLVNLAFVLNCVLFFPAQAQAQSSTIPHLYAPEHYQESEVSLVTEWGLYLGEWIPFDQINSSKYEILTIARPDFLNNIVKNTSNGNKSFVHGYGTYLLEIEGLNKIFKRPAIRMRSLNDAWQAWWVDENGTTQYLGESGKISKDSTNQEVRYKTTILDLPVDSKKGTLLIYFSSHLFDRGGLFGKLVIQEHEDASRTIFLDIASRLLLIGAGMFVVIQNLIFYRQRPKEPNVLLLAILAFVVLMRGFVSSDYFYVLLGRPDLFGAVLKLEYILVIWPAVACAHFFAHLCSYKHARLYVRLNYLLLVIAIIATWLAPLPQVIQYLPLYQISLVIIAISAFAIMGPQIMQKIQGSRVLMLSLLPLFVAICNDIYASYASQYNVFIAEYTLFIFLFIQSQFLASRYVFALETAEHLTDNLQDEIELKTRELVLRNSMLEEKAIDLEKQRNKIKELSQIDHLTGLYNRQTLEEHSTMQFSIAVANKSPLSVVMMDIDNFKKINDNYGHLVGDDCLKFVAVFLTNSKLRKDDIIARYGGEEIAILLADTDIDTAKVISERLCKSLSEQTVIGDHPPIVVTASFGVAERTVSKVESIEDLVNEADKALYLAKSNGKNRVEVAST